MASTPKSGPHYRLTNSKSKFNLKNQSIKSRENDTFIRTNQNIKTKEDLIWQFHPEVKTCIDNFERGVKISGDKNFLGTRKLDDNKKPIGDYIWQTYKKVTIILHIFESGSKKSSLVK